MKTKSLIIFLFTCVITLTGCSQGPATSGKDPWTSNQLLEPAELAKTLNNPAAEQPYVFCIGPQPVIKGSIDIGSTVEKANLDSFKAQLEKLPKDASIVIYCGCCPFSRCPNIRPAFDLLNKMQFKNHKLLDLPQNVKVDWIDKGYPIVD